MNSRRPLVLLLVLLLVLVAAATVAVHQSRRHCACLPRNVPAARITT